MKVDDEIAGIGGIGEAGRSGLRARKKLATREAISRAALRLALERGLENVRVDDIAAAAGVSSRTYNNYFSSREEAICFLGVQRAQRIGAALRARPAEERLDEAIGHAMAEEYAGRAEPDKVTMRMLVSEPGLQGEFLKGIATFEGPLAEAIAARTGTDAERDLFPRVLAAAVSSAARMATVHYLRTDTTAPFATVVRDALSVIAPAARAYESRRE
jgi:AcrR family transcriptional regulator